MEVTEPLLAEFSASLRKVFGGNLTGVYLTGSAAFGGWHEGKSDIDFTVLLEEPVTQEQYAALADMHRAMVKKYPRNVLEGQYITPGVLGAEKEDAGNIVSFHGGRMHADRFNVNAVTWYTLRFHARTVYGKDSSLLPIRTGEPELRAYVIGNVNSYWTRWRDRVRNPFSVSGLYSLSGRAVEWCVLGLGRMLYTLVYKDVTSKDAAGEFLLRICDDPYRRIVREAMRIRTGKGSRQYRSPLARRRGMVEIMDCLIRECNKAY